MSLNIKDLMDELAAGEVARQRIPELEGVLKDSQRRLEDYANHNQQLELKARDREDQISTLMGKIRDLTKDRDDALLAEMEADEKLKSFRGTVEKFSSAVASALSGIGAANDKLNPPKSIEPAPATQPVKEPEGNVSGAVTSQDSSQNATTAMRQDATANPFASGQSGNEQPSHGAGQSTGSQDQSESRPTSTTASSQTGIDPSYGTNPTWPPAEGQGATDPTAPKSVETTSSDVSKQEDASGDTRPLWKQEQDDRLLESNR